MERRLETLDEATAVRLLAEHHVGRLALADPRGPLVVPVNYTWHEGAVLFRSATGSKLTAARVGTRASFQVDHVARPEKVGWSVLVRGDLAEVTDAGELERLAPTLPDSFTGPATHHVLRLAPDEVTGRRIPLPDDVPRGWYREVLLDSHALQEEP